MSAFEYMTVTKDGESFEIAFDTETGRWWDVGEDSPLLGASHATPEDAIDRIRRRRQAVREKQPELGEGIRALEADGYAVTVKRRELS